MFSLDTSEMMYTMHGRYLSSRNDSKRKESPLYIPSPTIWYVVDGHVT